MIDFCDGGKAPVLEDGNYMVFLSDLQVSHHVIAISVKNMWSMDEIPEFIAGVGYHDYLVTGIVRLKD